MPSARESAHMNGGPGGRCVKVKISLGLGGSGRQEPSHLRDRRVRSLSILNMQGGTRVGETQGGRDRVAPETCIDVAGIEDVSASRRILFANGERPGLDHRVRRDGGGPPGAAVHDDFFRAEVANPPGRGEGGGIPSQGAHLGLVAEERVDEGQAEGGAWGSLARPALGTRRHIQGSPATGPPGPRKEVRRWTPDHPGRPPKACPMHVVDSAEGGGGHMLRPEGSVRPEGGNQGPSSSNPRKGYGRSRRPLRIGSDDRAHAMLAVGLSEQIRVRVPAEDAHEGRRRAERPHLEGEVRRVPARERLEPVDVALKVPPREIRHRRGDAVDDRVSDRDHAGGPASHPSRLPEALALQLFDDELVIGGAAALGAKEAPVRVADRVRSLPSAEPADGVGGSHGAPQKKSSRVSFFSVLRSPSGGGDSPLKSSLKRDFCWAGWVPVKS